MIERFSPLVRNIALGAVFLLLGWFCWSVRSVLNPLILGYLLAFVLHPLVLRLERRGWRRRKAVNFIFTAFALLFVLLAFGLFLQGRGLARQFTSEEGLGKKVSLRVDQALEDYKDEIHWVMSILPRTPLRKDAGDKTAGADPSGSQGESGASATNDLRAEDLTQMLKDWWTHWLSEERVTQAGESEVPAAIVAFVFLKRAFGGLWDALLLLILLPIYTYFLLFELERIHSFLQRYLPSHERARLVKIGSQIGEVLANFFRGRLLVCLVKGGILAVGLWLAGIDFALLLGFGTGFLSLIPFVGSFIGYVMALLVALLDHTLGHALLRTGIVFVLAELVDNYILIPKILGDSLGLHPIVVIFAIMAGGASLGMFGLLIALPLAASLVILVREFFLPVLAQMADQDASQDVGRAGAPGDAGSSGKGRDRSK